MRTAELRADRIYCTMSGIEHCAYISLSEGKLIVDHLWREDRTKEPSEKVETSDNKNLIAESENVYAQWDNPENLVEMYLVAEDNMLKIYDDTKTIR